MSDTNEKIQEILAALEPYSSTYPRQAIDDAVALKEEITPHLIAILEEAAADPGKFITNELMSHVYAAMLLAYFREPQAHSTIVKLFSLPERFIDPLFGDMITEDLASTLLQTCGGSIEQIKQLIVNKDTYDFCRSAASGALTYAVIEGYTTREEAIAFLSSLFTGSEADAGSDFWAMISDDIRNLYPDEVMPIIDKAFADDLINTWYIGPESFQKTLSNGKEVTLQYLREEKERRAIDGDIHDNMAWWAMFNEQPAKMPSPSLPPSAKPSPQNSSPA